MKPCPFCGSSNLSFVPQPDVKHVTVRCVQCVSCGGQKNVSTNNDEDVIAAWNQRPENNLTLEFSNPRALYHFALWLCESGEQGYWEWMEYRESEEDGDITARQFHYHGPESKPGKFLPDNVIRTTCGRKHPYFAETLRKFLCGFI